MAGLTKRFRLNRFGGGTPGTIVDNGQKYTSADRDTIDRLFAQTELHDHHIAPAQAGMLSAATLALVTGGGALEAGEQYRYRYAVVDARGMESTGSLSATIETPDLLATPGAPSLYVDPADVGTLPRGMYYYAVTALRGAEETPLSPAVTTSVSAGEGAVRVELPPLGLADSFRVWRMGTADAGFTKLGVTSAAEFIDNGSVPADPCACDPGNTPPQVNVGVSIYGITVTLPASVDLTTARSWRLYRSVDSTFPTASLVHEVVERQSEWDDTSPLLRSWTDDGGVLATGSPQDTDVNMRFQPFTLDRAAELPDPVGYPEDYPLLVDQTLYVRVNGAWAAVAGPGGAGGGAGVLTAPNGSRFEIVVANDGSLSTQPTAMPGPPAAPQNVSVI
jgi:hypothetical protein